MTLFESLEYCSKREMGRLIPQSKARSLTENGPSYTPGFGEPSGREARFASPNFTNRSTRQRTWSFS